MNLESPDILKIQAIWRTAKESTEPSDRGDVGSLRGWREIADRHVLDHALAQRAEFGHL
jgi:hypothetical protein